MLHVRAVVPCQLAYRDPVGGLLQALCDGVDETAVIHVVSAFNEVFNNVVHHARLQPHEEVEVQAARDGDAVTVTVADDGVPYEVQLPAGLPEELPERGMGLLIISRCMDHVSYERGGARNVFTMVKRLKDEPDQQERTA